MPTSVERSASPGSSSRSVHEKRNSPHPSKDFLHFKSPSKSKQSSRHHYLRDISESFYQDYTGGHAGEIGACVSTKGWGTRHGTDMYLGNALCNLAHDPGAPPSVDKKSLLRTISTSYSRSLMRSRSASDTHERVWSTNIIEDNKKAAARPRSQSAKTSTKRGESREIGGDVKRFLDSRTQEERGMIYKYLREKGSEKKESEETESKHTKKSGKTDANPSKEEKAPEGTEAEKKSGPPSPRKAQYSDRYKHQRIKQAQSATGTIFSVAAGRQPAHFAIFPDWPSEKDQKK